MLLKSIIREYNEKKKNNGKDGLKDGDDGLSTMGLAMIPNPHIEFLNLWKFIQKKYKK